MREAKRLGNREEERKGRKRRRQEGKRKGKGIGGELDVDPLQCQKRIDTAVVV